MEKLELDGSYKTPQIFFDPVDGILEISGRSIPENSFSFYHPVMEWLDEYIESPASETKIHIRLEYFNTSSSKSLVEIFRKAEKLLEKGLKAEIYWYYEEEDEDMFESGEDFKLITRIPIQHVKI
jgi:hypothetical protein